MITYRTPEFQDPPNEALRTCVQLISPELRGVGFVVYDKAKLFLVLKVCDHGDTILRFLALLMPIEIPKTRLRNARMSWTTRWLCPSRQLPVWLVRLTTSFASTTRLKHYVFHRPTRSAVAQSPSEAGSRPLSPTSDG